jgi:hypothetical protein
MRLLRLALAALFALPLAAACSASVDPNATTSGANGGASSSSAVTTGEGGGGSTPDGGNDAQPDVVVDCNLASDCVVLDDQCNTGTCVNGTCAKLAANEFGSCDDNLFCTENDVCVAGACVGGTSKFCPSLDSCHLGICDEALKTCKNIAGNDGAQCDDMNNCTQAGVCNAGVCTQGVPVNCSFLNGQCSVGVCDPGVGCKAMPQNNGVACDDMQNSNCSYGQCQNGMCVSLPTAEGTPCNDFLFCTVNDHCQSGMCTGDPNPCAPPENVCMIGTCQEFNQSCIAVPGNNGGGCSDGNPCTGGETCSNGTCVGGQPANNGMACDDANGCTGGTTCLNGMCGAPTSTIDTCTPGDSCCPPGCMLGNDADCLYWVPGVQQNVDPALLQGWTQCYTGNYAENQPAINTILSQCSKSKLLMACRPTGAATWTLLAMAPKVDVLFDCGSQNNCTKQSNGVGWYFSATYSWGFAKGGQAVNRSSCDYNDGNQMNPELRLCWHTGNNSMNSGYRCGANDLNGAANWQRSVFHAD